MTLPVTVSLVPGEALDSLLERVAAANDVTTAALTRTVGAGGKSLRYLAVAPHPDTLSRIGDLIGLPASALESATLAGADPEHRLDDLAATGDGHRQVLATGWVRLSGTQACPMCLADTGAWLTTWRRPEVTSCIRHQVFLAHECPACQRPLRDQGHSPLRPTGAGKTCGNPLGGGPHRQCRHDLSTIPTDPAPASVLATQARVDDALAGKPVTVLGQETAASTFLPDLRALTILVLHLATQPAARQRIPGTEALTGETMARTRQRGPRWGITPPADPRVRAAALATADHVLAAGTLDEASRRFAPWYDLTPATNESRLDWLADRTRLTPATSGVLLATHAPRRRLSRRLDETGPLLPATAIPQLAPPAPYEQHIQELLDCHMDTGRMYASLCLARTHPTADTWETAAALIGLPPDVGVKTVRAVNQRCPAGPETIHAAITALAATMDARVNWRRRENHVRRDATRPDQWLPAWAATHRPGMRATSAPYAVTWRWIHDASADIATSPAWTCPPTARQRAAYRQFATAITHLMPAAEDRRS